MKRGGEAQQPRRELMRRARFGGVLQDGGERQQKIAQLDFARMRERFERRARERGFVAAPFFEQRFDSRLRVLQIINGIFAAFFFDPAEIEFEMAVVALGDEHIPRSIAPDFGDEIAQGEKLAAASRHLRALAAARQRRELDEARLQFCRIFAERRRRRGQARRVGRDDPRPTH